MTLAQFQEDHVRIIDKNQKVGPAHIICEYSAIIVALDFQNHKLKFIMKNVGLDRNENEVKLKVILKLNLFQSFQIK